MSKIDDWITENIDNLFTVKFDKESIQSKKKKAFQESLFNKAEKMVLRRSVNRRVKKIDLLKYKCRPQTSYTAKNKFVESQIENTMNYFKKVQISEKQQQIFLLRKKLLQNELCLEKGDCNLHSHLKVMKKSSKRLKSKKSISPHAK